MSCSVFFRILLDRIRAPDKILLLASSSATGAGDVTLHRARAGLCSSVFQGSASPSSSLAVTPSRLPRASALAAENRRTSSSQRSRIGPLLFPVCGSRPTRDLIRRQKDLLLHLRVNAEFMCFRKLTGVVLTNYLHDAR